MIAAAELRLPGAPSLAFLAVVLVLLPLAAWRSTPVLRSGRLPRAAVWWRAAAWQAVLLALSWFVGSGFGLDLFAVPAIGAREVLWTLAALAVLFVLRAAARALRTEEQRRRLVVFALAPRTAREVLPWGAAIVLASVAEEAAYRGVAMSILWYSLGSPWVAAALCAVAFALAHWPQGGTSGVMIVAIALVLHALVALTGSLVPAMVVHAAYDFVAGELIRREALRHDRGAGRPGREARQPDPVAPAHGRGRFPPAPGAAPGRE